MTKLELPPGIVTELDIVDAKSNSQEIQKEHAPILKNRLDQLIRRIIPQESIPNELWAMDNHHTNVNVSIPFRRGESVVDISIFREKFPVEDEVDKFSEPYMIKIGSNPNIHVISRTGLMKAGVSYTQDNIDEMNVYLEVIEKGVDSEDIQPRINSPKIG